MAEEKHDGGDRELPHRKHDSSSAPADSHAERGHDERHRHSLTRSSARQLVVVTTPGLSNFPIPGTNPPGIFVDSDIPGMSLTTIIKELPIDESYIAQFHNSESEDIYTLYNACDGAVRDDGFLDITKLNDLSKEELEILNLKRLQEIWRHTISGCPTCKGIVRRLNTVRGMLGEEELESLGDAIQSGNGESH